MHHCFTKGEMIMGSVSGIEVQTTKKPKRKFGLAWLFSYEDHSEDQKTKVIGIDERIRGTTLILEASKKTSRVESGPTKQFSPWHPISWPKNCNHSIPDISAITHDSNDQDDQHVEHAKEAITSETKDAE